MTPDPVEKSAGPTEQKKEIIVEVFPRLAFSPGRREDQGG